MLKPQERMVCSKKRFCIEGKIGEMTKPWAANKLNDSGEKRKILKNPIGLNNENDQML
jgi:hypothetical protein